MSIETLEHYPFVQIGLFKDFGVHDLPNAWGIKVKDRLHHEHFAKREDAIAHFSHAVFSPLNMDILHEHLEQAKADGDMDMVIRLALGLGEYHGHAMALHDMKLHVQKLPEVPQGMNKYTHDHVIESPVVYEQHAAIPMGSTHK